MRSAGPILGYDQSIFRETLRGQMDQEVVEKILNFYMSKLSESDLRELDGLLEGTSFDKPGPERASTPAMDRALGSQDRQEFLRLGPTARNAIRRGRTNAVRGYAMDSAPADDKPEFPHANRLSAA